MGRQVKGDREALLAGCQVASVKGVALLDGAESGILADRPRAVGVHGGMRTAGEWKQAGRLVIISVDVLFGVNWFDVDALKYEHGYAYKVWHIVIGGTSMVRQVRLEGSLPRNSLLAASVHFAVTFDCLLTTP